MSSCGMSLSCLHAACHTKSMKHGVFVRKDAEKNDLLSGYQSNPSRTEENQDPSSMSRQNDEDFVNTVVISPCKDDIPANTLQGKMQRSRVEVHSAF